MRNVTNVISEDELSDVIDFLISTGCSKGSIQAHTQVQNIQLKRMCDGLGSITPVVVSGLVNLLTERSDYFLSKETLYSAEIEGIYEDLSKQFSKLADWLDEMNLTDEEYQEEVTKTRAQIKNLKRRKK